MGLTIDPPNFKPVYILGAGASKKLGAPLMDDFLTTAKSLRYAPGFDSHLVNPFDEVLRYQQELLQTRGYVSMDLDNIETLFSILDMDCQLSSVDDNIDDPKTETEIRLYKEQGVRRTRIKKTREDLFTLVIETLKQSIVSQTWYTNLIHRMAAHSDSCFITLNYDLAIEQALQETEAKKRINFEYGFPKLVPERLPTNTRLLLKLHGSVNWTYCEACKYHGILSEYATKRRVNDFPDLHLPNCRNHNVLNLVLPPTWYKVNYSPAFTWAWHNSAKQISLATHLFIIGYSMPRTDVFFDQLLTLGLRDNKNLKKVIVINPDPTIPKIIQQFFDQHFFKRKVLILPLKFEELHISGEVEVFDDTFLNEGALDTFLLRRQRLLKSQKDAE